MTQDDIIKNPLDYDLSIETVGKGTLKSPMNGVPFVSENDKISLTTDINLISEYIAKGIPVPSLESAGPRETIFHDPAWTRAGIVTCGGLCPGLNNVIKGLVQVLWFDYGVKNIFGIPYGYRGLNPNYGYSPIVLDPDVVDAIQEDGGTDGKRRQACSREPPRELPRIHGRPRYRRTGVHPQGNRNS